MIIDQKIREAIDQIRPQFPTQQALLLPLLHEIQERHGWISKDAMVDAAQYLELPLARVEEVVSFYTMYNRKPIGQHHIQICTNLSCFLRGADHLMACMERKLGIHEGETTEDGRFSLSGVECLAACGTAPVAQINKDYYENLDEESLSAIVDRLGKEPAHG